MYTILKRPNGEPAPTGNGIEPIFSYVYDKTGRKLRKTGEFTNTYEKIQSQLAETKIENIIRRYRSGDTSMLNTSKTYIIDSMLPADFTEMQNAIVAVKNEFNALPANIKMQFGNSVENYMNIYGTDKFKNIMGIKEPDPELNPVPETQTEPVKE